jgi:hypothetical protein
MYKTSALKCDRCSNLSNSVCVISKKPKNTNDTCDIPDGYIVKQTQTTVRKAYVNEE